MSLFSTFNQAAQSLYLMMRGPADSFCRLETADDAWTLVSDDGSLISAIAVHGARSRTPDENLGLVASRLTERTRSFFETGGHSLAMFFEYDPAGAAAGVERCLGPARVTARECGLSLDSVLKGWEAAVASRCAEERLTLTLWTTPKLLSDLERREAVKAASKLPPKEPGRQVEGRAVSALRFAHQGAREALMEALSQAGLSASVMGAHDLVRLIKLGLDPDQTGPSWKPLLPWDPRPRCVPEAGEGEARMLSLPSIGSQVFSRDAEIVARDLVKVGRRLHAPFVAALPPREPKPFGELLRVLSGGGDPLRACVSITPDGFDGLGLKGALARILSFSSETSRQLAAAIADLRALAESGEAVVGLSMAFETFVDIREGESLAMAEGRLRGALGRLSRKVAGWGQAQVQEVLGDPLLGVCATLPAMFPHGGPAPRAAAPLSAAWSFLPVRPASPFSSGVWPLRSPGGKIMPLAPMSSAQPAWIDLSLAPMGGGKSVTMNTLNLAFCLQPGLARLPWLSIIDVGPSSSGLISLIKSSLPDHEKHLAAHHKLTMDPAQAVNPLDTPLGCREPLPNQLSFLVNLLSLMATPLNAEAPPNGTDGLMRQAILAAYQELSKRPRLISGEVETGLLDLARNLGYRRDEYSSWWELTDFFFDAGLYHQAALAQRLAVPTISDVAMAARHHPGVKAAYGFKVEGTGEGIVEHCWRSLTEAASAYKCLCSPTRFSLGEARIIALDLDEVATRGGGPAAERQTAVMYMVARHLAGARFFTTLSHLSAVPPKYRARHEKTIREIARDPKRLCYDELHRVTGLESMRRQLVGDLETCARESRKWNLSLGLCSQNHIDIPKTILELATTVLLLGSGTERGRKELSELFGLNPLTADRLGLCGKPTPAGAEMVALFRTGGGVAQQLLVNTLPPTLLWAFSTTSEDMVVRDALYARHGVEKTLKALASAHPHGLKAEAERRKESKTFSDCRSFGGGGVSSGLGDVGSGQGSGAGNIAGHGGIGSECAGLGGIGSEHAGFSGAGPAWAGSGGLKPSISRQAGGGREVLDELIWEISRIISQGG